MTKVKFLIEASDKYNPLRLFKVGEVVDFADDRAKAAVDNGICEYVKEEQPKVEAPKVEPKGEEQAAAVEEKPKARSRSKKTPTSEK